MALNQIIDLSTTAGNNLDFIGVGIPEGMFPDKVNDAMRALAKILADAVPRHVAKGAGTYTPAKTDHNQFWRCTGAVTLNLTAAATLTDGWALWVRANGGAVTIDPNGAELIDGAATLVIPDGSQALIICTGTAFFAIFNNAVLNPTSIGATTPGTGAFTTLTASGTTTLAALTVSGTGLFTGQLFGLTLSNNAGDATNDIDNASGSCRDSTDVNTMVVAALTKRLDANWVVGTNQGGLDTGAIANTTYHVFAIKRLDTGVVDVLFSASATAPTMPANYTLFRRIGSIIREGGVIVPFKQNGDIFKRVTWIADRNDTAAFAAALLTLASCPAGIVVAPILGVVLQGGVSCQAIISLGSVSAGTIENQVAYILTGAGDSSDGTRVMVPPYYFTNTSQQLYFSQINTTGTPTSSQLFNAGWVDTRGRI